MTAREAFGWALLFVIAIAFGLSLGLDVRSALDGA